ncbi:MAG: S41 family peptidase [Defluviitaleaceae bacterium]|nr:S41 family peptidase [Defluviitaleaceae bacterium]
MNIKSFLIGLAAGAFIAVIITFTAIGYSTRAQWGDTARPDVIVSEILGMLERYSIIPFEQEELLTNMYRGLLDAVDDPYTQFFDQQALQAFQARTAGVFAGIGITSFMDPETRTLTVGAVFRGSPAEGVGMLSGDGIIAVDGANMIGHSQEYVVNLIRGPVGEAVTLTLRRDGIDFDVEIIRALIEVPTVSHEMLDNHVGLIRIDSFDRVTPGQFNLALEELTEQGMTGLVIDVRNNPGGLMTSVIHITNQFLPPDVHATYTEHAGGRREYAITSAEQLGLPLAVLVNGRSASASEILAAAVQDTNVGTVVGTQSFGKGTVQNLMYLTDGNAIKMTIARYYTPNGISIHGTGITPCIIVAMDEDLARRVGTLTFEEDLQLQAAWGQVQR